VGGAVQNTSADRGLRTPGLLHALGRGSAHRKAPCVECGIEEVGYAYLCLGPGSALYFS
jgi:hypothetical protein